MNKAAKTASPTKPPFVTRFFVGPNMIRLILNGTFVVAAGLFALLFVSYFLIQNNYVLLRLLASLGALLYLVGVLLLVRRLHFTAAAWMLLALYAGVAGLVLVSWGINTPIGVLLMGFVIILAGVMLGARYIIPVTIGAVLLMVLTQAANSLGLIEPDRSSFMVAGHFGDVAAYSTVFIVFALISWLSRRQMEQALHKALVAEEALEKEKASLAIRLEEKTRSLREAQLQEMRQLYRFAELGQLSSVVLHDLANYLNVLTLDIDDLDQRHHGSKAVERAKESLGYLDSMVQQARQQLQEDGEPQEFDVLRGLEETLETLEPKLRQAGIALHYIVSPRRRPVLVTGDALRFSHLITILISNAIDAYRAMPEQPAGSAIEVRVRLLKTKLEISVCDNGIGIPARQRKQLFQPLRSRKQNGMGIGLFIAKKMMETHFNGTLTLDPRTDCTVFTLALPILRSRRT